MKYPGSMSITVHSLVHACHAITECSPEAVVGRDFQLVSPTRELLVEVMLYHLKNR